MADGIEAQLRDKIQSFLKDSPARLTRLVVENTGIGVILDGNDLGRPAAESLRSQIESALSAVADGRPVNVVMSVARPSASAAPAAPAAAAPAAGSPTPPPSMPGAARRGAPPPAPPTPEAIPGVRHVVAVASGKGGVGKSTTSVNLALALSAAGLKVGIMDADIFGPSLPMLMGCSDAKPEAVEKILQPIEVSGVKLMSIGFLLDVDQPVVWRGPRVMGATQQLLRDVAWAPLDVLIVDMPPGTGDVQLTMVQQAPLTGAVIVSTPQDLALIDARKGLAMFRKVDVPILGIVENMSQFICPHCGTSSAIFGSGGAAHTAEQLGVPFLGAVPLTMELRAASDAGTPLVTSAPDSAPSRVYHSLANQLLPALS